jgi:hypothetical protein
MKIDRRYETGVPSPAISATPERLRRRIGLLLDSWICTFPASTA